MKQRQVLLIVFAVVLAAVFSFMLRDTIREFIILPLAYIWWLLTLYYHTVPQLVLWAVMVFLVFMAALKSTFVLPAPRPLRWIKKKTVVSPVESLAGLLGKSKQGIYYKWMIAHRLGKLTREMLDQREGRPEQLGYTRLTGRDWEPSKEVTTYLEIGLNGSFADFPQPRWTRPQPTPLDLDPQNVIEYLESEMEINRNGNR